MRAENHFALIVGVAAYQHITALSEAVQRDAQAIYTVLTDPGYCAYPSENVRVLLDADASNAAFRASLEWLANISDPQSIVTIYFSGHGGRTGDGGQEQTYLLPVDACFTADRSGLEQALSGQEFSEYLRAIAARKLLVIFDCCHAGGIGQPKAADLPQLKQGMDETYYQALAAGQGRAIVASSLDTEFSAILPDDKNSLFTKHLLAGLQGGVRSTDGLIRVFELFSYVQQQVHAEFSRQSPYFQCALQDNFPVALYKAGKKEAYPAPTLVDTAAPNERHYDFDVYISCALEPHENEDVIWVEDELIPELTKHDIKVAWVLDSDAVGVSLLDSEALGMTQSRRTIVIMSEQSVQNHSVKMESMIAQHMGIREGTYRVIPVYREAVDKQKVRASIDMLSSVHLASRRAEREMGRLIKALKSPLPKM